MGFREPRLLHFSVHFFNGEVIEWGTEIQLKFTRDFPNNVY
jgi:hypothetical protein